MLIGKLEKKEKFLKRNNGGGKLMCLGFFFNFVFKSDTFLWLIM